MLSDSVPETVQFIKKQFLCCVPIKNIQWDNFFAFVTWDVQEFLLNNTVGLDLVKQYPIKTSYQIAFLKYLINRLEKQNIDVNDCVYEAFGHLVALVDDSADCFKHYAFHYSGEKVITLQENSNIISKGTTGLCSWQASLALSEWCLKNSEIFKDKTVLELGSGVGLTGLVISLNCEPRKYYFTDCHHAVLETLTKNIKLNAGNVSSYNKDNLQVSSEAKIEINGTSALEVLHLPWEVVNAQSEVVREVDVVLAADVVYDTSLFRCLRDAVKCFLSHGRCKKVYVACTVRNGDTLLDFLCHLESGNLKYDELSLPPQDNFCWNTDVPVRLLEIK